jgi:hypothetical protein
LPETATLVINLTAILVAASAIRDIATPSRNQPESSMVSRDEAG